MRLSFLIFTKIAELYTRKMFCNHQIPKLNTRRMQFSNREIKDLRNLIPLRYPLFIQIYRYRNQLQLSLFTKSRRVVFRLIHLNIYHIIYTDTLQLNQTTAEKTQQYPSSIYFVCNEYIIITEQVEVYTRFYNSAVGVQKLG